MYACRVALAVGSSSLNLCAECTLIVLRALTAWNTLYTNSGTQGDYQQLQEHPMM